MALLKTWDRAVQSVARDEEACGARRWKSLRVEEINAGRNVFVCVHVLLVASLFFLIRLL